MFGSSSRSGGQGSGSGSGDQRKNQPKPPSSGNMRGYAWVDENDDDVIDEHTDPTPARSQRQRAMTSRAGRPLTRPRRMGEDTIMGGTDESDEAYPQGSMLDPLPGARVPRPPRPAPLSYAPARPSPPPPVIAGLPPPNQPLQLTDVPRRVGGRTDRRLLNTDPSMWWNQPGQRRTNPSSDSCYDCVVKHTRCDIQITSYPCTRCKEKELACKNGLPSQKWEQEYIASQIGGQLPGGGETRPPRPATSPNRGSDRSSRPERRDQPRRRRRSASPRRDEEDDEGGGEKDEYEGMPPPPKPTGRGAGRASNSKGSTASNSSLTKILSDEMYEKKWGKKRKCQKCTSQKLTCTGGRPCDRCRRTGVACLSMDDVPFSVHPPPPPSGDEVNDDEGDGGEGEGGAASDRRTRRRRPTRQQKGKQRALPEEDGDGNGDVNVDVNPLPALDQFNGLQNPYHFLRHDMQAIGRGVPIAPRERPLAVPVPPWWHTIRNNRLRQERAWREGANGYRGPLFDGVDPNVNNRPAWDQQAAQPTWFANETPQGLTPLVVRDEPVPYSVNRPYNAPPTFGRNMIDPEQSLDAQIPPPPNGGRIPWIATWNFDQQNPERRLVQTRGPLGWPYPSINSLAPNHQHNTEGFADAVNCCENENHFTPFARYSACTVNPAVQCEVLPRYDAEHERNPWHTCNVCRLKQWNHHTTSERSTLHKQKLYVCATCALEVRREGRSWPMECLCHASKTCRDLCHMHKEKIERAAVEPLLIAEDWLIRSHILGSEKDMCINCGEMEANPYSNVWACKLCREWVQDTSQPWVDHRR